LFGALLYYTEPLVFFDVLLKRGAYLAVALGALAGVFVAGPSYFLALLPVLLASPWLYRSISNAIDRVWLRRRYLPAEAERTFIESVQGAATQEDLRAQAEASLSHIFGAIAEVRFEGVEPRAGLAAALDTGGSVLLHERASGVPYMSDDERLLHSLARTLSVVRENVAFRQQQIEQQERERQLKWLASRAELKALRAQINPHFLFNALNAIAGLIRERPEEADETVEQLAQVFRYTLRKADNEWVRLEEELDFITAYLRVEQARFGARLRVIIEVEPEANSIPVPAMSVQPLVENAIKHGASEVEGQGIVRIGARVRGEVLEIAVTDNGPGFPARITLDGRASESDGGRGLRNIRDRLLAYYGGDASLSWTRVSDETRVAIAIPTRRSADASSGC
jgi:signal transduction histidine kinase